MIKFKNQFSFKIQIVQTVFFYVYTLIAILF